MNLMKHWKEIVLILIMILCAYKADAEWCYQESTNTSNQTGVDGNCGLSYTGNYYTPQNLTNCIGGWFNTFYRTFDGDWNTYGRICSGNLDYYVNYTKPENASISNNILQYKMGYTIGTTFIAGDITNISIPSFCYQNGKYGFEFVITPEWLEGGYDLNAPLYCWNSTNYIRIGNLSRPMGIYEEAMFWYINSLGHIGQCNNNFNITILNITLEDENTFSSLDEDISIDLTDGINTVNFENISVNNLTLCTNSSELTLPYSGTIYTTSEGNNLNKYIFSNQLYNGTPFELTLYNFPYTSYVGSNISTLTFTLKDSYYNDYQNIIGKLYRYYPELHEWLLVQMDKSDSFGRLFYDIIEQNVEYKIDFYDGSTYLDGTDSMKFICTNNYCSALYQIFPAATTEDRTTIGYTYDNSTRILNVSYNDLTNTINYITMVVTRDTITGATNICSETQYTKSGNILCNTTGYSGTVLLKVSTSRSPERYELYEFVGLGSETLGGEVGVQESGLWVFGMGLTIAAIGLFSPVGVVLMLVASLWISNLLGFANIVTMSILISATALGIIISYKVKT